MQTAGFRQAALLQFSNNECMIKHIKFTIKYKNRDKKKKILNVAGKLKQTGFNSK